MTGHDAVIHLASNPDIARAATEPEIDFYQGTNTVNATYNVTGTTKNGGATTTIGTNNITAVGNLIGALIWLNACKYESYGTRLP